MSTPNLKTLEKEREKASEDKADLFDFYNKHWDALVTALADLEKKDVDLAEDLADTFPGLKDGETAVNGGDLVDWLSARLYCRHERHDVPCKKPCAACEVECSDDPEEVCDECGKTIPFDENTVRDGDGSIANKHHDESCSLYDPDQE